jgi:hypothetical protein
MCYVSSQTSRCYIMLVCFCWVTDTAFWECCFCLVAAWSLLGGAAVLPRHHLRGIIWGISVWHSVLIPLTGSKGISGALGSFPPCLPPISHGAKSRAPAWTDTRPLVPIIRVIPTYLYCYQSAGWGPSVCVDRNCEYVRRSSSSVGSLQSLSVQGLGAGLADPETHLQALRTKG